MSCLSRSCDHGADGFAADAEVGLDEARDLARAGEDRLDVQAGEGLQLVEGVNVEGVAGGDDEGAVVARQRHEGAAVDELERHRLQRLRLDLHVGQIDEFHAELVGERGEDVLLLDEALLDDDLVEGLVGRGGGASVVERGRSASVRSPFSSRRCRSCIRSSGVRVGAGRTVGDGGPIPGQRTILNPAEPPG